MIESLWRLLIYVFYVCFLTIIGSMNPYNVYQVLNFHFDTKIVLNNITSEAAARYVLIKKRYSKTFCEIHRIRPPSKPKASNFIKKEAPAHVFSCEYWEMFKNTHFIEHFRVTASVACCYFKWTDFLQRT